MLTIAKYPQEILRKKADEVSRFDAELRKLASDMAEIMYADDGIGLAAPQVSKTIRLVVVGKADKKSYQAYVNPEITFSSTDLTTTDEGCLSLPGIFGLVKRPKKIHLNYQNLDGQRCSEKIKGMLAVVLQHEIDHLQGVLFIDRAEKITQGRDILDKIRNGSQQ
ncbi:MAG: peptide deformylase [Parcubacteria group bacterium]|nr:MAG: peptide deformylase [Parcubacteria group bacterium]